MLIIIMLARGYIKNFWTPQASQNGKKKDEGTKLPLPGLEDYNVAIKATENLLEMLQYLEYSWLITSLIIPLAGYNEGAANTKTGQTSLFQNWMQS